MLGNYIDDINPQLWICLWITFYLWMWIEASKALNNVDIQDVTKKNPVMRESKRGWDTLAGVPAPDI